MIDYLNKKLLILGCGNILFGDDGFGPSVISKIKRFKNEKYKILDNDKIGIIDAGTAASHFVLSLIDENTTIEKIIIIDAIDYNLSPGSLKMLSIEDLPNIPKYYIDAHDMPLSSMLIDINNKYNIEILIVGCQYKNISTPDVCLDLSKEVMNAIDPTIDIILNEAKKLIYNNN